MVLLRVCLLLFTVGYVYGLNIRAITTVLDDFNTNAFDIEVRKKMIALVQAKATEFKNTQDAAELKCSKAINSTIDDCNACSQSKCGSSGGGGDLWTFLGSNIKDTFVDKFPNVLNSGAQHVIDGLNNAGKTIGDGIKTGVDGVKHGAETALHGLTNTATDIGNQIKHGAETVGHSIANVAKGAVDGIKHIFGKRMDQCAAGCPSCVKIDKDTKTTDQMLTEICGSQYIQQKHQLEASGRKLQTFYNSASAHSIITKVEYDPTSIDVTHGVAFKTVFITANLNGTPERYQSGKLMKLTDLPSWATDLASELFSKM